MKATLQQLLMRAMTACLVLLSVSAQAQVPDAPTPLAGSAIGSDSFTANWEPVPGATSYRLDVSTSPTFDTPLFTTDIMITEYVEGGPGYKAIEIYNGTGADVNLGGYFLRRQIDGGTTTGIFLSGVMPHNTTRVYAYSQGIAPDLQAVTTNASSAGALNFDGNDAMYLQKNTGTIETIDVVGIMDQVTPWGADMTLRRKSFITWPVVEYSIADWDVYPMNDISGLGSHTGPTAFSFVPGYEDLTVNGTSQLVSGLDPNTTYYYRVRAVNGDGTSANSNVIDVTTLFQPTFGSVTQATVTCEVGLTIFNLTGLTPSSSYAVSYNLDGGPTQVADPVFVDANGNATLEVGLINDGQTLTVTAVQRTDVPSSVEPVTANNAVVVEVVPSVVHYQDLDLDGYGNINSPMPMCEAQSGWVLDNTDCDDLDFTINPGATEILYNGIDENCDGNLDEGGQYVTQVQASQCGATLPTIISNIFVTAMPQASMYRYEVTDVETSEVQTLERTQYYFPVTMLASYQYNKTYSVRVMVQRNGVWLGYYGPACTVSTPQVLAPGGAAAINPSQCGGVLPTISTLIATTSLAHVTGYRFRITNISDPSAPNQVQVIDRGLHWFALTMLPSFNYGATYTVEVAIRTTGDYSDYGSPCSVTAPAVPSLANCGAEISSETSMVTTASRDRATMYRFTLTNLQDNEVTIIDHELNWFRFNQVPNYVPGASYEVTVAVMTANHYSLPSAGCEITAPVDFARPSQKGNTFTEEEIAFGAKAYPNPFSASFSIETTTEGESAFGIKVYDMTGRLVEDRKAAPSDMQTLTLGESYPSGVYNVILTQGENVKTFKMIKR